MKPIVTATAMMLALAGASPAFAQAPGTQAPGSQAPGSQAPGSGQQPCAQPGDSSKTLSQKLDQGGGVICPPDVDPAIKAPTPQTGNMPVIPPPGSPGGDQKVQPK